jgi:hypothetical protein
MQLTLPGCAMSDVSALFAVGSSAPSIAHLSLLRHYLVLIEMMIESDLGAAPA